MIAWRYDQKTLSLSLIIYTSDIYIGSYTTVYIFPAKHVHAGHPTQRHMYE